MQKSSLFLLAVVACMQTNGQIARQWVASYNGEGDYNDRYNCLATDRIGNIYLGGSSVNPDVNRDYLIVKLSPGGVLQWSKEFNGAGDGPDEVTDIAIDWNGDVVVTGFSKGSNTGTDYLTIKMNSNGDTLWSRIYNNDLANEYDQANSIFVDTTGNIYVTGQSDGNSSSVINNDYATIKYNSSGAQQWVARFNGLGDGTDNAEEVVADGLGNVYVTGRSDNGNDDDYVTIKYISSGMQQWIKYDDRGGNDRATSLASNGNDIVISGRSDNGSNDDFWTLKYNSAGVLQWQKVYDFVDDDRAINLVIDSIGNIFVTGESDGDPSALINWDYQTVGYNAAGNQLWQMRYNGPDSNDDFPSSISTASGSVFVTGQSDADNGLAIINDIVTVSYNAASGSQNWGQVFAGNGGHDDIGNMVIPTDNGCIIAGLTEDLNTSRNAIAIAYNSLGIEQWQQAFNGIGDNNENIRSMILDAADNIYVAGYIVNTRNDRDMALVKFNSSGSYLCRQTVNGTSTGSPDDAQGVVLDIAGNPIVVGFTKNSGESNDITCYKTDANCNTIWLNKYTTVAGGSDKVYDIAGDATGNFYITGRVDADPSFTANDNCFTAMLDSGGTILWSMSYNSASSYEDRGSFVRVAPSGNVYVAGRSFNGTDYGILLLKYDSGGNEQWVRIYNGSNGNDDARDFKIDDNENLYVCGITQETDSLYDLVTLKYNSSGTRLWARKHNGEGSGSDQAAAIALDNTSNIYVAGTSDVDPGATVNEDIVVVKYDASGNQLWDWNFNGNANADDIADDIAVNDSGRIILTGHTNTADLISPNYDIITFMLDENGTELWSNIYNGVSDSSDIPNLLYLKGNDFYVAGSTVESQEQRNMLVIKYSGVPVGLYGIAENEVPAVFPNPFSNSLNFHFEKSTVNAAIEMRDEVGRVVFREKISGQDGAITTKTLAEGLYFYFITSGEEILLKGKLIHLKQNVP